MSITSVSQVRRIPDGRPAYCDLTKVLNDLAALLEAQLPEGVGFALRAEPNLWVECWERDLARFIWDVCARVIAGLEEEVGVATIDAAHLHVEDARARQLGLRTSGLYVCLEIAHTADHLDLGEFAFQARMMRGWLHTEAKPKIGGSVTILLPAPPAPTR